MTLNRDHMLCIDNRRLSNIDFQHFNGFGYMSHVENGRRLLQMNVNQLNFDGQRF